MDSGTQNLLLTILAVVVVFLIRKRMKRRPESLEPEEEVARILEKRETIKYGDKREKVIRKKLITAYIIITALWVPFYVALFRRAMRQEQLDTWLGDAAAVTFTLILVIMVARGAILQMGTQAIRGKEYSLEGEPTKIFSAFVKNRIPLDPAFIRNSLDIWKKTGEVLSPEELDAQHVSASEAAREDPSGEFYDFRFEDKSGFRHALVHKSRVKFMETMTVMDFQKVHDLVNNILEQRLGEDASIARLVWEACQVAMLRLSFRDLDSKMFKILIEGTSKITDKKKKEEQIKAFYDWLLMDRLQIDPKRAQKILDVGLPEEIQSLNRTVEDGIYFGGYHAEFCEISEYDTKYAIFAMPYPWNTALLFKHRDWIESANIPFKMFYTDMAWIKLGTRTIQTAPKEYEYCNILAPIYTEYDVEHTKGITVYHPMDSITHREFAYCFKEKAADPLLDQLIEVESQLQQKERFEGPDRKLMVKLVTRLWHSLNSPLHMLKAIWPYVALAIMVGFFFGYLWGDFRAGGAINGGS